MGSTVQQLLTSKVHGNVATAWGNFQEEDSNREYLRIKSPNISTSRCGLVVSVTNPWLGVSPDRMVHDPTSNPPDGLVEFKNPYSARNMTLDEAVCKLKKFLSSL